MLPYSLARTLQSNVWVTRNIRTRQDQSSFPFTFKSSRISAIRQTTQQPTHTPRLETRAASRIHRAHELKVKLNSSAWLAFARCMCNGGTCSVIFVAHFCTPFVCERWWTSTHLPSKYRVLISDFDEWHGTTIHNFFFLLIFVYVRHREIVYGETQTKKNDCNEILSTQLFNNRICLPFIAIRYPYRTHAHKYSWQNTFCCCYCC